MDISNNFDRCLQIKEQFLAHKYLGCFINEKLNGLLFKLYRLSPFTFLSFKHLGNKLIKNKFFFSITIWLHIILYTEVILGFHLFECFICHLILVLIIGNRLTIFVDSIIITSKGVSSFFFHECVVMNNLNIL